MISNVRALRMAMLSLLLVAATAPVQAAQHNFYLTVDARPILTSGVYALQANPNLNRLTLLYAHWNDATPSSNHFHGIGAYSYSGPAASPTIVDTNANNRIPEMSALQAPLTLAPGIGPFAGKLVSGENGQHYSDLTLYSIADLSGAPALSPESIMYNSNAGYTATPLGTANLSLELVSISPGLNLGLAGLNQPGDKLPLGGEANLPIEPVFWTAAGASPGTYSAQLRLIDESGAFGASGTFNFDFAVVPEPEAFGLMSVAVAGLGAFRRRLNL
jgi:hypothetical protein